MLQRILRPARYNTPIAALTIDGLGIASFQRSKQEWQVAFIRKRHNLEIEVTKLSLADGSTQTFTPIKVPETLEDISFSVGNGSTDHFGEFHEGFFKATPDFRHGERRTRRDDLDFRWVIDFLSEVPHGPFKKLIRKRERRNIPVTVIRIPNALFYTVHVTKESVILAPEPKGPDDPESFDFGRTNVEIGAVIYAKPTAKGATIDLVDKGGRPLGLKPFPLAYEAGHLYEISINNKEAGFKAQISELTLGDLHEHYKIMEVRGPRHRLFAPPNILLAIDGDCHPIGSGHNGGTSVNLADLNAG
ncbi:MAG TPA: hypothetical protein VGX92_21715 [Pyrinomonadaceae bacterium]|jgi:hypothetical protein|nr:hypothetical protein [Pyrinomonadaceae bacterium]